MVQLSVNVNKVATLRNSRGGDYPSVLDAVRTCVAAGARGITVHPRGDERHIRRSDVREIAALLAQLDPAVEFNIEGDPRADWIALVNETRPTQATLVPVRPGETTSEAGWSERTDLGSMREIVLQLKAAGARISMFVDPELAPIAWAKDVGADRVELYTEPFARAFAQSAAAGRESFDRYARAAEEAHRLGLGVNAGHDLDLNNLIAFRQLPHLDEVSIGHALIGRALFAGLSTVVREYLDCLRRRDR
ncbi:MAG TPA: pyridoxine 5'-phosphate synthase [Polyangiales bacterium]|nr:pyridoxine 5'-phosphate synthase [Polyangiales bacterium]